MDPDAIPPVVNLWSLWVPFALLLSIVAMALWFVRLSRR